MKVRSVSAAEVGVMMHLSVVTETGEHLTIELTTRQVAMLSEDFVRHLAKVVRSEKGA